MKVTTYTFTNKERELLVKGIRALGFYDLKGQEDLEQLETLQEELGGY